MMIGRLVALMVLLSVPLVTSCTALSARPAGKPVPAGYEPDKPGWAEKYVPGLKRVSNLLPPPTEARLKWDERMKRQQNTGPEGGESRATGW
jgi:hypothetical protein